MKFKNFKMVTSSRNDFGCRGDVVLTLAPWGAEGIRLLSVISDGCYMALLYNFSVWVTIAFAAKVIDSLGGCS